MTPLPTIKRLPIYLRVLEQLHNQNYKMISATDIASLLALTPIQVRKDLAYVGVEGKPKVGYPILQLIKGIKVFLGWEKTTEAFLIGAGALGSALMGYSGFKASGLSIVSAFDVDPTLIGTEVNGKKIVNLTKLPDLVERMKIKMAILTVPQAQAQEVTDILVDAGVKGIWNFSSPLLNVPKDVIVQNENIASGLAVLSSKMAQ